MNTKFYIDAGKKQENLTKWYSFCNNGTEFLYHNTNSKYSDSMDVYRISKENINVVRYDPEYHILTIIGEGELLAYDDYISKRINHYNRQRKFYGNTPYSIMTSFKEEDKVVKLISEMSKKEK